MKFNEKVSSLPRKKRLHMYNAGLQEKRKSMHVHVSKPLRKTVKRRAVLAKKGDKVKILRGEHAGREGKITLVDLNSGKIFIEGVIAKKQGGKEVPAPIQPSNCTLIEYQEPKLKPKKAKAAAKKEEKKGN